MSEPIIEVRNLWTRFGRQIVHRDVSPDNILIAATGRVYRSDVMFNPRSALLRTLIAWIIAAPIAIVIRAILLSRTAIPWQFVAVTLGLVGMLLVLWHGGTAWLLAKRKIA